MGVNETTSQIILKAGDLELAQALFGTEARRDRNFLFSGLQDSLARMTDKVETNGVFSPGNPSMQPQSSRLDVYSLVT